MSSGLLQAKPKTTTTKNPITKSKGLKIKNEQIKSVRVFHVTRAHGKARPGWRVCKTAKVNCCGSAVGMCIRLKGKPWN